MLDDAGAQKKLQMIAELSCFLESLERKRSVSSFLSGKKVLHPYESDAELYLCVSVQGRSGAEPWEQAVSPVVLPP